VCVCVCVCVCVWTLHRQVCNVCRQRLCSCGAGGPTLCPKRDAAAAAACATVALQPPHHPAAAAEFTPRHGGYSSRSENGTASRTPWDSRVRLSPTGNDVSPAEALAQGRLH
jgi:hypothetical protein